MKTFCILVGIIAVCIMVIAVLGAVIGLLCKEIRRWRLKVAFLESEIRRSDREMLQ